MARTVKKVFDIAVIAGCVAFFGSVALAGVVPASSPAETHTQQTQTASLNQLLVAAR